MFNGIVQMAKYFRVSNCTTAVRIQKKREEIKQSAKSYFDMGRADSNFRGRKAALQLGIPTDWMSVACRKAVQPTEVTVPRERNSGVASIKLFTEFIAGMKKKSLSSNFYWQSLRIDIKEGNSFKTI